MLLRLFLQSLLLLLAVAFTEKGIFALYHSELSGSLPWSELLRTLIWGIRFDLAISAALALLVTLAAWLGHRLLRRPLIPAMRWGSFLAAALLIGIQGADLLYYGEAGRHLGYELKEWYNSGSSLALAALQTYTLPVLLQLLLLGPLYFISRWLFALGNTIHLHRGFPRTLLLEVQLVIVLLLAALLVRGGTQSVPLEPLHAQQIGDSHQAVLALNGGYNALFSSITPYSISPRFAAVPTAEERALVKTLLHDSDGPLRVTQRPKANVIFVLLESWSGAYMHSYGYEQLVTPHFDQLRREGITSRAMMTGGHRTTEGMFATFCSLQNPLGQTVAQSQLQNYDYQCLPRIAREEGYHTAFFQGTNANTSGTGAFAQLLGFSDSYGKADMPPGKLPDNSWGRHDPDIYDFTLDKLRAMPRPFMVGINTNSTHDAQLPAGAAVSFGKDSPAYISALHYADGALGDFVNAVRSDPQLKDTVLVLLADHPGLTPPDAYRASMIPFVILAPGIEPAELPDVLSQRDVAPSVADLLALPASSEFTGQSVLRRIQPRVADYYHQGTLG
ncbi:MAG TPA: LTA synthase family protein, partial [Gammaproteobacteria bacterium]